MGNELSSNTLTYLRDEDIGKKNIEFIYTGSNQESNFTDMEKLILYILGEEDITYALLFEKIYKNIHNKILPYSAALYHIGDQVDKNCCNIGFSTKKIIEMIKDRPRPYNDIYLEKDLILEIGKIYTSLNIEKCFDIYVTRLKEVPASVSVHGCYPSENIIRDIKHSLLVHEDNVITILLGKLKVISILYYELTNKNVDNKIIKFIIDGIFKMYYIKILEYRLLKIAYEMNVSDKPPENKKYPSNIPITYQESDDMCENIKKYLSFFNPDVKYDEEKVKRSEEAATIPVSANSPETLAFVMTKVKNFVLRDIKPKTKISFQISKTCYKNLESHYEKYFEYRKDLDKVNYRLNNSYLDVLFLLDDKLEYLAKTRYAHLLFNPYKLRKYNCIIKTPKSRGSIDKKLKLNIPYSTWLKDGRYYLYFDIEEDRSKNQHTEKEDDNSFIKFVSLKNKIIQTFILGNISNYELQNPNDLTKKNPKQTKTIVMRLKY